MVGEKQKKLGLPKFVLAVDRRLLLITAALAKMVKPEWRNWQTRRTQNPFLERECGFKSLLRHHLRIDLSFYLIFSRFLTRLSSTTSKVASGSLAPGRKNLRQNLRSYHPILGVSFDFASLFLRKSRDTRLNSNWSCVPDFIRCQRQRMYRYASMEDLLHIQR